MNRFEKVQADLTGSARQGSYSFRCLLALLARPLFARLLLARLLLARLLLARPLSASLFSLSASPPSLLLFHPLIIKSILSQAVSEVGV